MTSVAPGYPSYRFNDNALAATDKISAVNVDVQLRLAWEKINALIAAVDVSIMDDNSLSSNVIRLSDMHAEVISVIGSAQGWQPKAVVDTATTANITLFGEQTIDGVPTSYSRVLVKNQTDPTLNGIYTSHDTTWSRASDANTAALLGYAFVTIDDNSLATQRKQSWVVSAAPGEISLGTSGIPWVLIINNVVSGMVIGDGRATHIAKWDADSALSDSVLREVDGVVIAGASTPSIDATLSVASAAADVIGTKLSIENHGASAGGATLALGSYAGSTELGTAELKVVPSGAFVLSRNGVDVLTATANMLTSAFPLVVPDATELDQAVALGQVVLLDGSSDITGKLRYVPEQTFVSGDYNVLPTKRYVDDRIAAITSGVAANIVTFENVTTGTAWAVPAGVTLVMAELWGAGQNGSAQLGGASGAYARVYIEVSPGQNLSIRVGGTPTNSMAQAGYSAISKEGVQIATAGGGGAAVYSGRASGGTAIIYVGTGETIQGGDSSFMVGSWSSAVGRDAPKGGRGGVGYPTGSEEDVLGSPGFAPGGGGGGFDWDRSGQYSPGGAGRVVLTY